MNEQPKVSDVVEHKLKAVALKLRRRRGSRTGRIAVAVKADGKARYFEAARTSVK